MKVKTNPAAKPADVTAQRTSEPRGKTRTPTEPAVKATTKRARPTQPAAPVAKAPDAAKTKLSIVIAMMSTKHGATLDSLVKATGWQKHSVRGAISGAIKRKQGLQVEVVRGDDGTTYRIVS